MEATLGQQDPLEQTAGFSHAQSQHISWPERGVLTAVLRAGRSLPITAPQGPLRRDWGGARGDRRVAGRVRARVNSKNFMFTELTYWADVL